MSRAVSEADSSAAPRAVPSLTDILGDFYRIFAPTRTRDASHLAAVYAGRERELFSFLEARYGAQGYFASPQTEFRSQYFDPRLALYAQDVVPPVLLARPLDSVHKASVLLPGGPGHMVHLGPIHDANVARDDVRVRQSASCGMCVLVFV